MIRDWLAFAYWTIVQAGYIVRPYDMLADRRRWRWKAPARCGWPAGTIADWAAIQRERDRLRLAQRNAEFR